MKKSEVLSKLENIKRNLESQQSEAYHQVYVHEGDSTATYYRAKASTYQEAINLITDAQKEILAGR